MGEGLTGDEIAAAFEPENPEARELADAMMLARAAAGTDDQMTQAIAISRFIAWANKAGVDPTDPTFASIMRFDRLPRDDD